MILLPVLALLMFLDSSVGTLSSLTQAIRLPAAAAAVRLAPGLRCA
jgi:hypothetical protein